MNELTNILQIDCYYNYDYLIDEGDDFVCLYINLFVLIVLSVIILNGGLESSVFFL